MSRPTTSNKVLHVNVRSDAPAAQHYMPQLAQRVLPDVLAAGIQAHSDYDLVYKGGKTITNLTFTIFYPGGQSAVSQADRTNIDHALAAAMSDRGLNNVVQQYFTDPITSTFRPSAVLSDAVPASVSGSYAEGLLTTMQQNGQLSGYDLSQTVFCFVLPSGVELTDEGATSFDGLGGFHGEVSTGGGSAYYAIVVYAEKMSNGKENGIVAFDQPWKNVSGALYHELNEARTDADVNGTLGWVSNPILDFGGQSVEVGDAPVFEAGKNLGLVFKEVPLSDGNGTVPVQLLWSNAVHGPEGPVANPDPPASRTGGQGPNIPIILGIVAVLIVIGVIAYFLLNH